MAEIEWRKVITEATEVAIFEALEDPAFEWRTASRLAEISGLDIHDTRGVLMRNRHLIRQTEYQGEDAYTLRSRYHERGSFFDRVRGTISGSSSSSSTQ